MTASVGKIKVLALDLDGTVLTHDYRMSERTVAAVARFREAGGEVLIASGRSARSAYPWALALGGVAGMICHNGAAVYATYATRSIRPADHGGLAAGGDEADGRTDGRTGGDRSGDAPGYSLAVSTFLPESSARRLVELSREGAVHFHTFSGDDWLYERKFRGTDIYRKRAGFDGSPVDFDSAGCSGFFKAMFVDEPGPAMDTLARRVRELLGDQAEVMFTSPGFLEIVAPGVSKASGLAGWLGTRGRTFAEVLAFGDAENDEAMLLAAGVGVAMGNAPESLKTKVGRTAASVDEDGVALAIEAYLDGKILDGIGPIG